eukprot:TRINITY_DN39767_c0_g1_i1.p1 TRINITY_DN39767_c0_g1~~TRINITY_DN39767_c0_g1_i1.p1  ORF type:complete len:963 (-),score=110.14 TRINITY_DN39767_c0_g1_i1:1-2889(-)
MQQSAPATASSQDTGRTSAEPGWRCPPPVTLPAPGASPRRRALSDEEVLYAFDEFLYHGEIRDFLKAQHSYERISSSLGTEDSDTLIPPCLEVLEFSNQFIRNDTLLCLLYISLGCTLCDIPSEVLIVSMRRHAAILAKHDAMPMFVRSLDFLLGYDAERAPVEEGMLERDFRLIFNCIYLQLLFHEHDEGFFRSLELGQGRLGASLVSLLFEATKMCADNDKIPIKKVILLLLRVMQCLLDVPDHLLYPMPNPEPPLSPAGPQIPMQKPQLREFQAFTALHIHERNMLQKYNILGCPAALEEGLQIIRRYQDEFILNYAFHPSEVQFMQNTAFLQDAYKRYEDLRVQGRVPPTQASHVREPRLPESAHAEQWASKHIPQALGALMGARGSSEDHSSQEADAHRERPLCPSEASSTFASDTESEGVRSEASSADERTSTASVHSLRSTSSQATAIDMRTSADALTTRDLDDDPLDTLEGPSKYRKQSRFSQPHRGGKASHRREPHLQVRSVEFADPMHDRSPTAVFQRLYMAIFPRLTDTMVLLLRLLLTSCSNVETYPGVIDLSRERHATAIPDDSAADRALLAPFEKAMPSEATEAQRHREIMAAAVSGLILMLLKQARKSVAEQFSCLAQLITDSNGALVVLKFLNQDLSSAMEPRDPTPVMACLQGRRVSCGAWVPSWPACATLRLVEVLYLLCKDSPERVRKYLIHYKAPFILKRLQRIENHQVQSLVLKLLKKQVRYLPRKWKQTNMKAISAIYSLVPMSPLEDWLLNEPFGDLSTEGPSQADIRASNVVYNTALLRQMSSGSSRAAPNGAPTASSRDADWDVSARTAGGNSPYMSSIAPPGGGLLTHAAEGSAGSAAPAADMGAGDPSVAHQSPARIAALALTSSYGLPGMGFSPSLLSADSLTVGCRQAPPHVLCQELADATFGYSKLFPEFVPCFSDHTVAASDAGLTVATSA